ncbi:unnamed protein product [Parnassius apollo]|uniref:(apollo) hypothetical protein n=1 Tax=Parnassius apollo TaxID=110799 RepID=A0A8S3W717_PARAO|nr:unnamed protein product [Parnassius apollo]
MYVQPDTSADSSFSEREHAESRSNAQATQQAITLRSNTIQSSSSLDSSDAPDTSNSELQPSSEENFPLVGENESNEWIDIPWEISDFPFLGPEPGKSEGQEGGQTSKIVTDLLDDYLNKGYKVYTDNYYNSVELTRKMSANKTYLCGTLQSTRKGNPKVVTSAEERNQFKLKPNIVVDYNNGMGGVDYSYQMISYYESMKKTKYWYKKFAIHIFQMFIHNAARIHNGQSGLNRSERIPLLNFTENVIIHLLSQKYIDYSERPGQSKEVNQSGQVLFQHYLEYIPPTEKKSKPTKP